MAGRLSLRYRNAFTLAFFLSLLLFAAGFPPVAAQTVKELEKGLENCQADLVHLDQRMQDPCRYILARDEVCEDIRGWIDNLKRIRASNPTPYRDPAQQAKPEKEKKPTEKEKKVTEKEKECSSKAANVWGLCEFELRESIEHKIPGLYSPEACAKARREDEQCKGELSQLITERNMERLMYPPGVDSSNVDSSNKQAAEQDARIAEQEKEYTACLQAIQKRDECRRLQGQYTSVATSCDSIKRRLQAAQHQQQQQPTGKVRVFMVGNEPKEVGNQVTYQAEVGSDAGATRQTRYGYYWYLNGSPTIHGYSPSYTFQAPQRGVNTIMVRIVRTGDGGRTWQGVGEATDKFNVQWGPAPAIGENKATVTLDLRDSKTNQPVTGWMELGGKDLSRGSSSYTFRNIAFGTLQVRAGSDGYKQKNGTLNINQNPYRTVITLERADSPAVTTPSAPGWVGEWLQSGGTVTIKGTETNFSAAYQYRRPPTKGVGSWESCEVNGNTAKCSAKEEYEDEEKFASRHGTVQATLKGDTITGVFVESTPTFRWKPGSPPWNSSIREGQKWPFTLTRKR
jgi:hypothetical protein